MMLLSSFIFGVVFGSFLNVVIYRLKTRQNLVFGGSFCPQCKTKLKWHDLVPILSFMYLRGRCRYCHKKISWQYPIVELLSGFLWVGIFYKFSLFVNIYYIFILSSLLVIAVYDAKYFIIPDRITYPAIVASVFYNGFQAFLFQDLKGYFLIPLLTALVAFSFFFLIFYFSSGRAMGLGDAKLAILIAIFLGPLAAFIAFDLAFILGGIYGIILLMIGKKTLKSAISFGPFLVIGAITALFVSNFILKFLNI